MEEMITTKELLEWLKINKNTALKWRKEEGLPYIQLSPINIRYNKAEVEKWLEKRKKVNE